MLELKRISNLTHKQKPIKDIIIIGVIGAQDNLLFESSSYKVEYCQSIGLTVQHIMENGESFIKVSRSGGGAAHYFLEELLDSFSPTNLLLYSILADMPLQNKNLFGRLDKYGVDYQIDIVVNGMPPAYFGMVFDSEKRYWCNKLIDHGVSKFIDVEKMGISFSGELVVLCSLPVDQLIRFRSIDASLAVQLFENYLFNLYKDNSLKNAIFEMLKNKCVILNINETELWHLGRIYYDFDYLIGETQTEISKKVDELLDILSRDLKYCLIVASFGAIGAMISYNGNTKIRMGLPSINLQHVFGVGAGDTGFAGAIKEILKIENENGRNIKNIRDSLQRWDERNFLAVLRGFVTGGVKGASNPNIFDVNIVESKGWKRAVLNWEEKIQKLASYSSFEQMVDSHKTINETESIWKEKFEFEDTKKEYFDSLLIKTFPRTNNIREISNEDME